MDAVQIPAAAYGIQVAPAGGEALITHAGRAIARSTAAKIMSETRLPATLYVPRRDVLAPLAHNPHKRTFCPFKGTASYWDVAVGNHTLDAAAWSYETPLKEAESLRDHVAFAPGDDLVQTVGGAPIETPHQGHIAGPLVDWLLREAPLIATPEELTRALGHHLNAVGVWVSRLTVLTWSLHPLIAGRHYVWTKSDDGVDVRLPSYDFIDQPKFANSPLRHVAYKLGGVRQRLGTANAEFAFEFMDELHAAGATDYVAMPLTGSAGLAAHRVNVLSMVCDHPSGFTTANLGHIFECSFIIARLYEVFTQRENFTTILDTYIGHRTGERVLAGEIRRGDGDEIDAAILFCDLRGSTRLETELTREVYFALLNHFFEVSDDVVRAHGGETLKFIGDALMAVFPAQEGDGANCKSACVNALKAARSIVTGLSDNAPMPLDCAIGVAFGNVTYGNIGSRERLDFTVIGAAANLAARLSDYSKVQGCRIAASGDVVAGAAADDAVPLGKVTLHGLPAPVAAFAIDTP